jgi:hypothetical protein
MEAMITCMGCRISTARLADGIVKGYMKVGEAVLPEMRMSLPSLMHVFEDDMRGMGLGDHGYHDDVGSGERGGGGVGPAGNANPPANLAGR